MDTLYVIEVDDGSSFYYMDEVAFEDIDTANQYCHDLNNPFFEPPTKKEYEEFYKKLSWTYAEYVRYKKKQDDKKRKMHYILPLKIIKKITNENQDKT